MPVNSNTSQYCVEILLWFVIPSFGCRMKMQRILWDRRGGHMEHYRNCSGARTVLLFILPAVLLSSSGCFTTILMWAAATRPRVQSKVLGVINDSEGRPWGLVSLKEHAKLPAGEYVFCLPTYDELVSLHNNAYLPYFGQLVSVMSAPPDVVANRPKLESIFDISKTSPQQFGLHQQPAQSNFAYSLKRINREEDGKQRSIFLAIWYAKDPTGYNWLEATTVELDGGRASRKAVAAAVILTPLTVSFDLDAIAVTVYVLGGGSLPMF